MWGSPGLSSTPTLPRSWLLDALRSSPYGPEARTSSTLLAGKWSATRGRDSVADHIAYTVDFCIRAVLHGGVREMTKAPPPSGEAVPAPLRKTVGERRVPSRQ